MVTMMAYNDLDKALTKVKDNVSDAIAYNINYFHSGDKYLSNYVNSIKELKNNLKIFSDLFEDLLMEIEQAELEAWEDEQCLLEQDYYNTVGVEYEFFN